MPTIASNENKLEITSVVLRTPYVAIVRDGRKFYLVNTKKVTEGRELVCMKKSPKDQ